MSYPGGYNPNQGGYINSPSNFAPPQQQGGYFANSPHDGSPNTDQQPQKRSGAGNQSLTPVTIKQLNSATQAHTDDVFKVDNHELNQVTIVGQILTITNLATNVNFQVDDGTGKIEVRIWLDSEDKNDFQAQQKAEWREGIYVRIVGNLRSFHQKRSVVAFRITPIKDFNEITYHFLETIYVHLQRTRVPGAGQMQGIQQGSFNPYQRVQQSGGVTAPILHSAVMQTISNARANEGVSIQFICDQLGRPESEIRPVLELLSGEGHVFSTIDDDHYQTTDTNQL
jgi:replication factor A2